MSTEEIDPFEPGLKISEMWRALADQIAAAIPDHVIAGNPLKAIHWATCAEACFWKATGENDAHDVKDVLPVGYGAVLVPTE